MDITCCYYRYYCVPFWGLLTYYTCLLIPVVDLVSYPVSLLRVNYDDYAVGGYCTFINFVNKSSLTCWVLVSFS